MSFNSADIDLQLIAPCDQALDQPLHLTSIWTDSLRLKCKHYNCLNISPNTVSWLAPSSATVTFRDTDPATCMTGTWSEQWLSLSSQSQINKGRWQLPGEILEEEPPLSQMSHQLYKREPCYKPWAWIIPRPVSAHPPWVLALNYSTFLILVRNEGHCTDLEPHLQNWQGYGICVMQTLHEVCIACRFECDVA